MNNNAQSFANYLDSKDLHYSVREFDDETGIECNIGMDNTKLSILSIFDNNEKHLSIKIYTLAHTPESRYGQVLMACNDLNKRYRWVKFYLDKDGDVNAELDAIVDNVTGAEESFELMVRIAQISDEAYPVLMKAIYA